jgi:hypothetical protein
MCYLNRYDDLRMTFDINKKDSCEKALEHWNLHGKKENRNPKCSNNKAFNCICYLNRYADLQRAFGTNKKDSCKKAWNHWNTYGKKENRNPTCGTKRSKRRLLKEKKCYKLWQQINNDQAASRCPVDETDQNKGTCGIPKHLDMYGQGAINGMEFQMDDAVDVTQPLAIEITSTMEKGETAQLEKWINDRKKEICVKNGNIVVWKGKIPDKISQFIRDNCNRLKFTVKMGDAVVDFDGLTFRPKPGKSRRRRLLRQSQSAC